MTFSATKPGTYQATVSGDDFYPPALLAEWQEKYRIDDRWSESALFDLLALSVLHVHTQLQLWQEQQKKQGYTRLEQVPGSLVGGQAHNRVLYHSAVYNHATAEYLLQFSDYASSDAGQTRSRAKQQNATLHYRNSSAALRMIQGKEDTFIRLC